MMNVNNNFEMTEINDNVLENVIGGIGARPPKRPDNFMIKKLAEFLYWLAEGRFKWFTEVTKYDEEHKQWIRNDRT